MNSPSFPDGLLDNLPVAAFVCDTEGRILQFNDLAAELWQCRPSADDTSIRYCASESLSTLSGEPIPKDVGFCALAMKTGSLQAGEAVMTCKGPRDVIVRASSSPIKRDGTVVGAITVLVDVTQRFESERRLRELTNFHQSILENSAEGICVFHISETHGFQFSLWNQRMVELTGYTMSEVNQLGFCQMLATAQGQTNFEQYVSLIQQGTPLHNRSCHIVRSDGSQRALRLSTSVLLRDPDGPTCVGMFTDVTQESQIRSDLESSQERLALAVKAAQLGLWDWNIANNTVYFSDEWGRQLGLEPEELTSEYADWAERLHPDDAPNVMEHVQAYLSGEVDTYDLEFRMRHADGSYRWLQSLATSHRDADGKPTRVLGCHLDITKSKSTEATLRHILESIVSTTGQAFFSKVVQYLQGACDAEFAMIAELPSRDSKIAQTVAVSQGNPFQYHLQDTPCQLLLEGGGVCHFDHCQERFPKDAMLLDMGLDSYMGVPLLDSSSTPIGLVAILKRQPFEDPLK